MESTTPATSATTAPFPAFNAPASATKSDRSATSATERWPCASFVAVVGLVADPERDGPRYRIQASWRSDRAYPLGVPAVTRTDLGFTPYGRRRVARPRESSGLPRMSPQG